MDTTKPRRSHQVKLWTTDQILDQARRQLDATPFDSPSYPRYHKTFCQALAANDRYHACDMYVPSEGYGSICADCNYGCEAHADFNPNGGAW
jgi:hypothetical protein